MIKSITTKKIFEKTFGSKKATIGWSILSDGFFVNTINKFGSEDIISRYVKNQGIEKEYKKLHHQQISLF